MTAFPKPRPKLLDKREAKADTAKIDKAENAKVKQRSGGGCEVIEAYPNSWSVRSWTLKRCRLRASHVHHLISGIGRRNVGKSIEAAHKLHVCDRCHEEIHGHVLKPVTQTDDATVIRYERVK